MMNTSMMGMMNFVDIVDSIMNTDVTVLEV